MKSHTLNVANLPMPLFYQHTINQHTRLAIWKIEEDESFFASTVPLQATITHPHKRLQHLAGRYLLRYLFPAFPYEQIQIASTKKPYLANEAFHFSISHCDDFAAAIVSTQQRVGIDIENITPRLTKIMHKYLSTKERDLFNLREEHQISNPNYLQQATLLWSVKEALFKWWGNGNVDFKTMLQVNSFSMQEPPNLECAFVKEDSATNLVANYQFFNKLVLAYVVS